MADLTITAADVEGFGSRVEGIAGGTITAGMAVRKNTDSEIVAASDDSAVNAAAIGIALNNASAGQPVSYQISGGLIDLGATIAIGKVYVLSGAGGIAPVDDVAGGEFVTIMGIGTAADRMKIGIIQGGVAAAGAVA
jgi:hypothetical protein